MKKFKIDYVNPRKKSRVVDSERFERSSAFYPVLQLKVDEFTEGRYRSAGYKRITRIS